MTKSRHLMQVKISVWESSKTLWKGWIFALSEVVVTWSPFCKETERERNWCTCSSISIIHFCYFLLTWWYHFMEVLFSVWWSLIIVIALRWLKITLANNALFTRFCNFTKIIRIYRISINVSFWNFKTSFPLMNHDSMKSAAWCNRSLFCFGY